MPTRSFLLSPDAARILILAIGALGMLVWLGAVALWFATRRPRPLAPRTRDLPHKSAACVRDAIPRAAALQQPVWDLIGGDPHHAILEIPLPGRPRLRATVEPLPKDLPGAGAIPGAAAGCRVTCSVESAPTASWYQWLMPLWLLAVPIIIIAAGITLWTTVAPSPNPAIRGQAIQMLHVGHFVWPPFLFWTIQRRLPTLLRGLQDRFLTTLELL